MRILLIGNGAREHAIFKSLKASHFNPEIVVFAKAKNPGMYGLCESYEIGNIDDLEQTIEIADKYKPDFAIIGPDNPIGYGAADALDSIDIPSFAPFKSVARLESSKSFTRDLMHKYQIPGNPRFKIFTSGKGIDEFIEELNGEYVVKYDGLYGGKGVKVSGEHLDTIDESIKYAEECILKTGRVVVEEKLVGPEFSLMSFADGHTTVKMPAVADHKRAFDGDMGPNTGGMGSYSDNDHKLPFLEENDIEESERITRQTLNALYEETGTRYRGIMYGGFMKTASGVKVIEFNSRFGDPEAMNVLPILKTDFVELVQAVINGELTNINVEFDNIATVCLYVVPEWYPGGKPAKEEDNIISVKKSENGPEIFFASVDLREETSDEYILDMSSSRALAFTGKADTIERALQKAKEGLDSVNGKIRYRTDIGTKKLIDERINLL